MDLSQSEPTSQRKRKHFWHIDYLLDKARIYEIILIPTEEKLECTLAIALKEKLLYIFHFGSSDCRCPDTYFSLTKEVILISK